MNNLLETASAFSKLAKAIEALVQGTGDMVADRYALRSGQPPRAGATSTSTSPTQAPTIVLLMVC